MPWSNQAPLEKLNWLIHLQHVRRESGACKELIKREITKSNGRNEYAFFKKVKKNAAYFLLIFTNSLWNHRVLFYAKMERYKKHWKHFSIA